MGRRQTGSLLKKAVLPHTRNLHEAERSPPTSRYPMCGGSAAFGTGASPNPARSTPGNSRDSYRPGPTSWRLVHPQLRRQPHAQTLRSSGPCPGTEMVQAEKEVWRFLFPPKCSGCRDRGCATNEPIALMSEVGHVRDNSWSSRRQSRPVAGRCFANRPRLGPAPSSPHLPMLDLDQCDAPSRCTACPLTWGQPRSRRSRGAP